MGRLDYILSTMKRTAPKLKVLVLFDGSGCVSKMARQMGYDVRTLDILPLEHIDLPMDIMQFIPAMLGDWVPDMVWASPPCETYSCITRMKGGGNFYYQSLYDKSGKVVGVKPRVNFSIDKRLKGHREKATLKATQHRGFVNKTVEIIQYYTAVNHGLVWFIENPATGCIRYILDGKIKGMVENKTTYCMYSTEYRKETSIFSNMVLDLKYCPRHKEGVVDLCGGHSDNLTQRYDHKAQSEGVVKKRTYLERSHIPAKLCMDILYQGKKEFETMPM
jgi:hypothetical protein